MRIHLAICLILFTMSAHSLAQGTAMPDDFPNIHKAYQEKVSKVEWKYVDLANKTPIDYSNALNRLEQSYAKNGNLDGVLAVRKEKGRFAVTQDMPDSAIVPSPTELRVMQEKFRDMPATLESAKKKEIAKLSLDYIAKLENIKDALTRNMKIDEAVVFKTEIDRVRSLATTSPETQQPNTTSPRLPDSQPQRRDTESSSIPKIDNLRTMLKFLEGDWQCADGPYWSFSNGIGTHYNGSPGRITMLHFKGKVVLLPDGKFTVENSNESSFTIQDRNTIHRDQNRNNMVRVGKAKAGLGSGTSLSAGETDKTTPTLGIASKLPPNEAKSFGGHRYLAVLEKMSWHQAKEACEKMGGHLVVITTKEENAFVATLANEATAWIGFTDEKTEGKWVWVNSERPVYTAWANQEPNNQGGVEHYAVVYPTGAWNDAPERDEYINVFICEWET